jgi:hypothetical protein
MKKPINVIKEGSISPDVVKSIRNTFFERLPAASFMLCRDTYTDDKPAIYTRASSIINFLLPK